MSADALAPDDLATMLQRQYGTEPDRARALAAKMGTAAPRKGSGAPCHGRRDTMAPVPAPAPSLPVLALHARLGDSLRLVLRIPPRTKKNGTTLGIRQKPAYTRYRNAVVQAIAPRREYLALPKRPYNLRALYYVDRYGKTADLVGLHQGLFDALEDAGVIPDDWYFRTTDGSRVIPDDPEPRVECWITPIEEVADG